MFPHQYQDNILINFDAEAGYTISEGLRTIFMEIRDGKYDVNE